MSAIPFQSLRLLASALPIACAMLAGTVAPSWARVGPEAYLAARMSAANHLQIRINEVTSPEGARGDCMVTGTVAQVFRGDMARGAPVTFAVSCYRFGAIPKNGSILWTDYDALAAAQYLEAFMTEGPNPAISFDQIEIIIHPREWPYCSSNALSCETSALAEPIASSCTLLDRALTLFGLLGADCAQPNGRPVSLPALREH